MAIDSSMRIQINNECRAIVSLHKQTSTYIRTKHAIFLYMVKQSVNLVRSWGLISDFEYESLAIESFSEDDHFYCVDFLGAYDIKFNKYDGFDQILTTILYHFKK